MNLTAVTDEAEVMTRHVADSLAVLPPLERAYASRGGDVAGISLIDVGSGAGLPGLILAVVRPSNQISVSRLLIRDGSDTSLCFIAFLNVLWSRLFQAGNLHC